MIRLILLFALGVTASLGADHPKLENPIIFQRAELDPSTGKQIHAGKLWIMDGNGSNLRQLTFGDSYDEHPSLYSDLQHVLYSEFNADGLVREAGAKLVKLNIYSGAREIVAEQQGCALHHATLSPMDDLIAYHKDCGGRISQWLGVGKDAHEVVMQATNGVRTRDGIIVMHEKNVGTSLREVSLALVKGRGRDTTAVFLTDDRALHRRAAISPDGKRMAWQSNAIGGEDEILLAEPDGSNVRNLTQTPGEDGHPWFSRDGQWIVFESNRSGNWEIWRMKTDGTAQQQLTDAKGRYVSTRARM